MKLSTFLVAFFLVRICFFLLFFVFFFIFSLKKIFGENLSENRRITLWLALAVTERVATAIFATLTSFFASIKGG